MKKMLTLTHATERDIDLLLIEEFAASESFSSWFLSQLELDEFQAGEVSVFHSTRRMHNRREIDISVDISAPTGRALLLVENKLDTDEQPGQAESYREEAELKASEYHCVLTVLVCPEHYIASHQRFAQAFDRVVTYEAVCQHFNNRIQTAPDEIGARCLHRANLIEQAITKSRRGYVQVVHPGKRAFSNHYVTLLKELGSPLIPGPSMKKDSGAESVTMIFEPKTLPKWPFLPQMRIVHQLREANANINFYTWGDHFPHLAQAMAPALQGTEFRLVPTVNKRRGGRSGLMIVAETPKVDQFADFDQQRDAITQGIRATEKLRDWLLDHRADVDAWSRIVAQMNKDQD